MGLDSVELIIEIEKFFDLKIEDREAEKLATIQETVNLICLKKWVTQNRCLQFLNFSNNIAQVLNANYNFPINIQDSNLLEVINLRDKATIQEIQELLNLKIEKFQPFSFPFWHNLYQRPERDNLSFTAFAEAIAMLNYTTLYPTKNFSSAQAIYIGVGLVTYEKSGVNIFEIARNKSFTNDLGID